jgi:hypothetical protein
MQLQEQANISVLMTAHAGGMAVMLKFALMLQQSVMWISLGQQLFISMNQQT